VRKGTFGRSINVHFKAAFLGLRCDTTTRLARAEDELAALLTT
jgi:hypothetical protein